RSGDARSTELRARKLHEERDPDLLAIEKDAVLVLAVVAQPLPMVGKEDDDRAVVEPFLAEEIEEASDDRVGGGDFSVVRRRRVARAERIGRGIRRVRLVEVEKGEEMGVRGSTRDPVLERAP